MISVIKFNLLAVLAAVLTALSGAAAADLSAIRLGEPQAGVSRLVIEASEKPAFSILRAADGSDRLVILLPDSEFKAAGPVGRAGLVTAVSSSTGAKGARLGVALSRPAALKDAFVLPPSASNRRHRLVIDLVAADSAGFRSAFAAEPSYETIADVIVASTPPLAASTTAGQAHPSTTDATKPPPDAAPAIVAAAPTAPSLKAPAPGKPVIVIDAGHGGGDPGAAGQKGAKESAVTLAAAKSLAEILRASGRYEVVLTRQTDIRVAHEERSRLAREAKADLFISLHADAHADAKVRGGSVYTLSEEGTVRSAREAKASGDYVVFDLDIRDEDPQVGGILYNLAQRKTGDESDRFAERLIGTLAGVTPMLNNTHRRGNFKVLLAPDVPAVLLELAFISNARDEANLTSPAWRRKTMTAVAGAIDAYFAAGGPMRHAATASRPVAGAP
jgi:N-acetylmuramoyl-L-alanine amidase